MQELWVAQGTYSTSGSFSFQPGISYYGGFGGTETILNQRDIQAHPTILSRTAPGAPIVQNQNLTATTRLDGFVIQGGNTPSGGGMYNQNSSPTLANCTFKNNTASGNGGGLYNDEASYPTLLNCNFTANKAAQGGAIYTSSATSLTLVNTQFSSNTATSGGALFSQNSSPLLTRCLLTQNTATKGGAIYTNNSGGPTLINTQFIQNTASSQGGALFASGANNSGVLVKLINCILVGNQASQGGAFYNALAQASLMNCSLSGNSSASQGGAFYNLTSSVDLTNSVVWNNGGSNSFANSLGGTVSARFSLLEATVSGYNSETANLMTTISPFVSSTPQTPADLVLAAGSFAINRGNNTAYAQVNGPTTDLAGNPRILQTTIDMGAYEGAWECTSMYTLKAGAWNDVSIWSCGRVPLLTDVVTLNYAVSLPPTYQGQALRVIYSATGRLIFGSTSRLRLGGN
ncbi:hypothetical protein IC229_26185 [Spirosoma sp. BT702]|uniref:Right-handed parallel beta-helix repeat-containing protein n=1 Tax=Spirosoma profusum TaxID=2771354 RepID=A0A927ATQ8_9BACT|nr:right-handed parallel beta-helix repeat-containing protein [Spirosoma profusum]MBD2704160.1 hypothetical protein [Spirosoma profusum]